MARIYSCTGILHRDKYRFASGNFGFDFQLILAGHQAHCFHRVKDQIYKDLLQLGLIGDYTRKVIKQFGTYGNAVLLNKVMQEQQGSLRTVVEQAE